MFFCFVTVFFFIRIGCWSPETSDRPSFSQILHDLEDINSSSFVETPLDSFRTLQDDWKIEIADMFDDLRSKEHELESREEELSRAFDLQREHDEMLKRREQELADREIELIERELNIMILQQFLDKPSPKKRKGVFKSSRLKLLANKEKGKNISTPSDFRHNITVKTESPGRLRAIACKYFSVLLMKRITNQWSVK